jgi:CBS domain-containing protein
MCLPDKKSKKKNQSKGSVHSQMSFLESLQCDSLLFPRNKKNLVILPSNTTVQDAINTMTRSRISAVPVAHPSNVSLPIAYPSVSAPNEISFFFFFLFSVGRPSGP